MKYIATFNGAFGYGNSLQETFDDLEDQYGTVDRADVKFFEVSPIDVEFKIVEKTKPVKINKSVTTKV